MGPAFIQHCIFEIPMWLHVLVLKMTEFSSLVQIHHSLFIHILPLMDIWLMSSLRLLCISYYKPSSASAGVDVPFHFFGINSLERELQEYKIHSSLHKKCQTVFLMVVVFHPPISCGWKLQLLLILTFAILSFWLSSPWWIEMILSRAFDVYFPDDWWLESRHPWTICVYKHEGMSPLELTAFLSSVGGKNLTALIYV